MEKERIYVREENLDKFDWEKLKGRNVHLCILFKKEGTLLEHQARLRQIQNKWVKELDEILDRAKAPSTNQQTESTEVYNRSLIDFVEEE